MSKYRVAVYVWNQTTHEHDRQTVMSEAGDCRYPMDTVPRVGDIAYIAPAGWLSVGTRQFLFPTYGSTNWPYGEVKPLRIDVDLVCAPSEPMVE